MDNEENSNSSGKINKKIEHIVKHISGNFYEIRSIDESIHTLPSSVREEAMDFPTLYDKLLEFEENYARLHWMLKELVELIETK